MRRHASERLEELDALDVRLTREIEEFDEKYGVKVDAVGLALVAGMTWL